MAVEKEELEDLTPTPWFYWFVCGVVLILCCGVLWFSYDVYAKADKDPIAKPETTILMHSGEPAAEVSQIQKTTVSPSLQEADALKENPVYMAIVIDDMGISQKRTKEILSLQAPLTSSFLTYGKNLKELCAMAQEAGHEIMIHVPMEPEDSDSVSPDMLTVDMTDEEIKQNLHQMLEKFDGMDVKGVNNHMGSLLTTTKEKMDVVMKVLKNSHLFFLDSKTTPYSVAGKVAQENDVTYLKRDVFLDNQNNYEYISKQLKEAEKIAFLQGFSIVIGHPKSETYRVLKDWLESKQNSKIQLVHLSELIDQLNQKNETK